MIPETIIVEPGVEPEQDAEPEQEDVRTEDETTTLANKTIEDWRSYISELSDRERLATPLRELEGIDQTEISPAMQSALADYQELYHGSPKRLTANLVGEDIVECRQNISQMDAIALEQFILNHQDDFNLEISLKNLEIKLRELRDRPVQSITDRAVMGMMLHYVEFDLTDLILIQRSINKRRAQIISD